MQSSPRTDLQFLSHHDNFETADTTERLYEGVRKGTHAAFYLKDALDFAVRSQMTNE